MCVLKESAGLGTSANTEEKEAPWSAAHPLLCVSAGRPTVQILPYRVQNPQKSEGKTL